MKRLLFIVLLLLLSFAGCVSTAQRDVPFDYSQVLTKEYRFGTGRVIPLTFERSVNVSGTITTDGKYFIYASNRERNNFDIYLRPLNDITTFRLTVHPAKDFAPDVSPDGKWCVFVSTRDDPQGDILLMKLSIDTILSQSKLEGEQPAQNLTTIKDTATGAIVPIRDASPCFSPDGKWIAFSSEREGEESIFIMSRDGNKVRKITSGMQPRFSNDGNAILFTKQDGKETNIYRITIATGAIQKLTNNSSLQLSPCYGKTDDDIYFTRVEHDTNSDGVVDASDNGMLYYYNVITGEEYPLTLIDEYSTAPRWVPYADGVIVYSVVEGEHINMAMIPHTGIIPKQKNALRQYELALKYKEDFDDIERYQRCLFATYYFFREAVDIDSQMIIAKALYELSRDEHYTIAKQILQELSPKSKPASLYAQFILLKENNTITYLEKNIQELKLENNEKLTPFFIEELADRYAAQGFTQRALTTYRDIVDTYATYSRLAYVRFKIGRLLYGGFTIPEEWIVVLGSSYTYLKNEITMEVINATKQLPAAQRYAGAKEAVERYTLPIAKAIFQYIAATSLDELGQNEEAWLYLKQGLANTKKLDVAYFLINVKSGELAQKQKSDDWAGYYEAATNNFQVQWKQDIRPIIEQLTEYFETNGQKLYEEGKYKESGELYKRYITMNTLLYLRRRYQDVYNINAAGAHIGYINASIPLQNTMLDTLKDEYSGQGHRLSVARMDFDKAHIYALGYIYVQEALTLGSSPHAMEGRTSGELVKQLAMLKQALYHIDWALFIDDRFVDAYILKGWVYQYVDELRMCCPSKKRLIDSYFSEYLWEQCIPLYEKALEANDEIITPRKEADIHTNLANIYFLLKNYTLALPHYNKAVSYQKAFTSLKEEAQFYYHYGYCLWQQGNYSGAYAAMQRAYTIYKAIAQKNELSVKDQLYTLYKYFALFQQMQGNYTKAIDWYTTCVIHAARYNHEESNSRLYIAIAECYRKLGNDKEALTYLELAEKNVSLTKEKQYKIGLKIVTLGPVYVFTVNQDDIIIGEGKIVSELSSFEMQLLIHSMTAEIYISNGRFTDALTRYDKIIKLAGNRKGSLFLDVTFSALQNAGYCAAQSGQIADAVRYYEQALAIAQKESIAVDKVYRMMLQWAYCYTAGSYGAKDALHQTDVALDTIEHYTTSMYERVYAQLSNNYINTMKAQKKRPVPEDIEKLSQQATKQVEGSTISFNALYALLLMQKATIMANNQSSLGQSTATASLYSQASALLSQAIDYNANDPYHQEFVIKLLINRGICNIATGKVKEGYDDIISARFKANAVQSKELVWFAEATVWDYANRYNSLMQHIENPDSLIAGVLSRVELLPQLYARYAGFIYNLYDRYTDYLLNAGKYREAFTAQQRKQIVALAMSGATLNDFHNKGDDEFFTHYKKTCFTVYKLERALTQKIVADGKKELIDTIKENLSMQYKKIDTFRKNATDFMAPYVGAYRATRYDVPVLHFYDYNGKLYCWIAYKNTVDWRLISDEINAKTITADIEAVLQNYGNRGYVILNDSFMTIHPLLDTTLLYKLGCIPCAARAPEVEKKVWLPVTSIATDMRLSGIPNVINDIHEAEYIVDSENKLYAVTARYCFTTVIECSAVVKNIQGLSLNDLLLLSDAALYADVATIIGYYAGGRVETIVRAISSDDANLLHEVNTPLLLLGKTPSDIKQRESNALVVAKSSSQLFNNALGKGDYTKALLALLRWKQTGLHDNEYTIHKIKVLLYQGKIDDAVALIQLIADNDSIARSYLVYAYLLQGHMEEALKALKGNAALQGTLDNEVYAALIEAWNGNQPLAEYDTFDNHEKSLLPLNQLRLLYIQFAALLKEDDKAGKALQQFTADYILSQRELCLVYSLGYAIDSYPIATNAGMLINSLKNNKYSVDTLTSMDYDALSLFVIHEIVLHADINEEAWLKMLMAAQNALQYAQWIDIQFYTIKIADNCNKSVPQRSIQLIESIPSQKGKPAWTFVLQHIVAYQKTGKFKQAHTLCTAFHDLPFQIKRQWYMRYLYSVIAMGKTKEAGKLLDESGMISWDKSLYDLFLMNIQLQKMAIAKKTDESVFKAAENAIARFIVSLSSDMAGFYYSDYPYLLDKLFNYMVSYSMSRGNQKDALQYAELHRMIYGIAVLSNNEYFKQQYDNLVRNAIPITAIQKKLPKDVALLYTAKNENDIFAWIITRTYIQPVRLSNCYSEVKDLVYEYYNNLGLLQPVGGIENNIDEKMKPVIKECAPYSRVIIFADVYTDAIPFEAILYHQSGSVVAFMPSLVAAMGSTRVIPSVIAINIGDSNRDSIIAAVKQSGVHYGFAISSSIIITDKPLWYSDNKKNFVMDDALVKPGCLIIDLTIMQGQSYNTGLVLMQKGIGGFITFNCAVIDVNRLLFLREFLTALKSKPSFTAYADAFVYVIRDKRYKHPANWVGIRFYSSSMNYLYKGAD